MDDTSQDKNRLATAVLRRFSPKIDFISNQYPFRFENFWPFSLVAYKYEPDYVLANQEHFDSCIILNNAWGIRHRSSNLVEILIPIALDSGETFERDVNISLDDSSIAVRTKPITNCFASILSVLIQNDTLSTPEGIDRMVERWLHHLRSSIRDNRVDSDVIRSRNLQTLHIEIKSPGNFTDERLYYFIRLINYYLLRLNPLTVVIELEYGMPVIGHENRKKMAQEGLQKEHIDVEAKHLDLMLLDAYLNAYFANNRRLSYLLFWNVIEYVLEEAWKVALKRSFQEFYMNTRSNLAEADIFWDNTSKLTRANTEARFKILLSLIFTNVELVKLARDHFQTKHFTFTFDGDFHVDCHFELSSIHNEVSKLLYGVRNAITHYSRVRSIYSTDKNLLAMGSFVELISDIATRAIEQFGILSAEAINLTEDPVVRRKFNFK